MSYKFCKKVKGKGDYLTSVGQTGKDCLLTWADGVKVPDRRDRTRNLSLRKRRTNHCTTGPHINSPNIVLQERGAAILKLVFAVDNMLRRTSKPISSRHFPNPLQFWVPASFVNILLEDTPKINLNRMKIRDSKRVHVYAAQNGCFLPLSFLHSLFCLCSSSGLKSRRLILLYVLTAASLTILLTMDLLHPVSLSDSLLVTDGLDQLVPLLFWPLYCSSSAFCL